MVFDDDPRLACAGGSAANMETSCSSGGGYVDGKQGCKSGDSAVSNYNDACFSGAKAVSTLDVVAGPVACFVTGTVASNTGTKNSACIATGSEAKNSSGCASGGGTT